MSATKDRWKRAFGYAGISDIPSDAKGVYAFWCSDTCLYVGMSDHSIRGRLTEHWNACENPVLKDWLDAYAKYVEICYLEKPRNIGRLEEKLIRKWNPKANIVYNRRQGG